MKTQKKDEIEIKIEVTSEELAHVRQQMESGYVRTAEREKEENLLFDFPDRRLTRSGSALRLRQYGSKILVTFKGPRKEDKLLKIREEIETGVQDFNAARNIFEAIGLEVSFEYGKFREKFCLEGDDEKVEVCIDETPVGNFVEIEGSREEIRRIAASFNWETDRYIQKNYIDLYRERLEK